jgi:hypothetical protein
MTAKDDAAEDILVRGDRVDVISLGGELQGTLGTVKRVEIGESGLRLYHVRWDDGFQDDDPWASHLTKVQS